MRLNNEIIKSSFFCLFKTDLLVKGEEGIKTDYEKAETEIKDELISKYLSTFKQRDLKIVSNIKISKGEFLDFNIATYVSLTSEYIDIIFDSIEFDNENIVPIYFSSHSSIERYEKVYISCLAFILGTELSADIKVCKIVYERESKIHTHKLNTSLYFASAKEKLVEIERLSEPIFCLNKHCNSCEFWNSCIDKAKVENHLSLLRKVTPKIIEQYKRKGIFTVNQLSYLYKPRRTRKKDTVLLHNIELQALALRTEKIIVKAFTEISHSEVEIFIDFESVPKLDFCYLFGVIFRENENVEYFHFWIDAIEEQKVGWEKVVALLEKFPNSKIYHYGNFEVKVLNDLSIKYNRNIDTIIKRCVNLNGLIHGKIYFPVYSNSLKDIGAFLGVNWKKNVNGLQSIAWRYYWEKGHCEKKSQIIDYNKTDCLALIFLLDKLQMIVSLKGVKNISQEFDFIDNIGKQSTEKGKGIHHGFEAILKVAHENYDSRKLTIRNLSNHNESLAKVKDARKGVSRKTPKATKVIKVRRKINCPVHGIGLCKTEKEVERTITDIVFTKHTVRKQVLCFKGVKSYCPECSKYFLPPQIEKIKSKHFGHGFQAWIVYQRLYLRLPYNVIKTNLIELFKENISSATISNTLKYLSQYYKYTEKRNLSLILESPFIHADETKVNVLGKENYVWVFTNGKQIYFRLTETRENKIVKKVLGNYKGTLISDFYPGYDSFKCNQQKCWVHLLRDINDDLWKNPFDSEFECFVDELKQLIIPIFETIERFGSKKRFLKKHIKQVDKFYVNQINDTCYNSILTQNYQKRFKKNRKKLFIFLEYDNIPWNNNMAERALRHIAIQRKISTYFAEGVHDYLLILGIMQTCRFNNQSFLQFLISGKKTLD